MAILESCCFWKNVRNGSFACALYTLIYFGLSTLMFAFYLIEEQDFLLGHSTQPVGESILEKGDVTVVLMVLGSLLLIAGLRYNKRAFLLPWIGLMICDLLIECGHLIYLMLSRRVNFDPIVGFIFTIDFFILCLNLYCLLCVISQYQAYRVQRTEQQQEQHQSSPTVVFTTPEKLSKSKLAAAAKAKAAAGSNKRPSHRLLAASPLITSQRPTNISTITEEEEQQQQQQQEENEHEWEEQEEQVSQLSAALNVNVNGNAGCSHNSEPLPTKADDCLKVNIPIITLDPNSLQ